LWRPLKARIWRSERWEMRIQQPVVRCDLTGKFICEKCGTISDTAGSALPLTSSKSKRRRCQKHTSPTASSREIDMTRGRAGEVRRSNPRGTCAFPDEIRICVRLNEKGDSGRADNSERRYRRLFETAKDGILISMPSRGVVDVNPFMVSCWAIRMTVVGKAIWNWGF